MSPTDRHQSLAPAPDAVLAAAPWTCSDEGVISDAAGRCVCVLGPPFEALEEQDLANGAAILALPDLLAAGHALREVRPSNWNDGEDPACAAAWRALNAALAKAEGLA